MAKLHVVSEAEVSPVEGYAAPCKAEGVTSSKMVSPPDYPLWLCVSTFGPGGRLSWATDHGDEAVYVLEGTLDIDGRRCERGGALVIEAGVPASCTAAGPVRLAHFGSSDKSVPQAKPYGPPVAGGHCVHLIGPRGWFESGAREGVRAVWYADSTCPTCRLALLLVERPGTGEVHAGPAHAHSEDEIIFVLRGSVLLGKHEYGPGSALCIPGDVRYVLSGGRDGHAFLNYRRDVSEQTYYRKDHPPKVELEGGLVRGGRAVMDVENLPARA